MTYQNLISRGGDAFKIIMLILTLSIINLADSAGLEMRMYNVGQANFIALKHGTNALIVDCGSTSNTECEKVNSDLTEFLKGVEKTSVFITHCHADHFNRFEALSKLISLDKVIIGGNSERYNETEFLKVISEKFSQKAYFCEYGVFEDGKRNHKFYKWNSPKVQVNINTEISKLLGEDVKTELLLPSIEKINEQISEKRFESNAINDDHFQNLIMKVSYGGRAMLLPGDANGTLLSCLPKEDLENIDTVIFPHHGSIANDEDRLFDLVQNCCLGIISSDPSETHSLPRKIQYENVYVESGSTIQVHDLEIGVPKQGGSEKTTSPEASRNDPIFLTSMSEKYLKLTVSSDGIMKLYNTDNKTPLFTTEKATNGAKCNWDRIEERLKHKYSEKQEALKKILEMIKETKQNKEKFKELDEYLAQGDINAFVQQMVKLRLGGDEKATHAANAYLTILKSRVALTKKHFENSVQKNWTKVTKLLRKNSLVQCISKSKKWCIANA